MHPAADRDGSRIEHFTRAFMALVYGRARLFTHGRRWHWKATALAVGLSLLLSFPSIDVALSGEFESNWAALKTQIDHPLTPALHPPESHAAKIAFRLTVPVFLHALGLGVGGALLIDVASGILFFFLLAQLLLEQTHDRVTALLGTAGAAGTFAGVSAFCDLRCVSDALAICFLLVAMRARSRVGIAAAVVLGAFTDERAALASSIVMLFGALESALSRDEGHLGQRRLWSVVFAGAAYLAIRWMLGFLFGLRTPVGDSAAIGPLMFARNLHGLPFSLWTALEGLWIPVIGALLLLVAQGYRGYAAAIGVSLALSFAVANSVIDVTRSAIYVFPVFPLAARVLARFEPRRVVRLLILWGAALALIAPTYYSSGNHIHWHMPLPLQLFRMFFYSRSLG